MRGVCNPRSQECLHFCLLAGDWREDGAVSGEAGSDDGQSETGQERINTLREGSLGCDKIPGLGIQSVRRKL